MQNKGNRSSETLIKTWSATNYALNFLKLYLLTSHKINNVEIMLKLWGFRNLSLERGIAAFKVFKISKVVFEALLTSVLSHITKALEIYQTII